LIFFVYERGKTGRILEPGVKSLTHTHTHTLRLAVSYASSPHTMQRALPAGRASCCEHGLNDLMRSIHWAAR